MEQELALALEEAADNFVAIVCNEEQCSIEEAKADPVVAKWYALLDKFASPQCRSILRGLQDVKDYKDGK